LAPVGRLDKDTEGVLLLTNDGDVAYKLTHPKFNIDKTYQVKILGRLSGRNKKNLRYGVIIEGKKTAPAKIDDVKIQQDQSEFFMTIHEGRKRQIRLMLDCVGHKVIFLKRVSQGPLMLGSLKVGQWRPLSKKEIDQLK